MNTNINELIYTLEILNPKKLEEIRKRHPGYAKILESGITLGKEDKKNTTDNAVILIKAELSIASNKEVLQECDTVFPKIIKRIKKHKKLNLFSQIATAICSATVISTIKKIEWVAIVFGIVGLVASLVPIVNDYLITGLDNKKINESFEELIRYRIEIEGFNKELDFLTKIKSNDIEKISEIINYSNDKTVTMRKLLILS